MKELLIIFAKNPILGKIKTRLAKSIGDEKALGVYTALLKTVFKIFKNTAYDLKVYYSGGKSKLPKDLKLKPQKGSDLGKRMRNAFKENLKKYNKVIIIGTDCPFVNKSLVRKTFKSLDKYKIVLGPAHDGGYYLIGIRKPRLSVSGFRSLFENIPWGTGAVLKQTIKQCKYLGINPYLLRRLHDIDTVNSLKEWERSKKWKISR